MERRTADLSPTAGPGCGDDSGRCVEGRRSAAIGENCGGGLPRESAHGFERVPGTSGRGVGREQAGHWHVRESGSAGAVVEERAKEFPEGGVAADPRDDPATRADGGRIARRGRRGRGENRWGKTERRRGGTLTNGMH